MHYRYKTEEWVELGSVKSPQGAKADASAPENLAKFIEEQDRAGWEMLSMYPNSTQRSHFRLVFRKPAPCLDVLVDLTGGKSTDVEAKQKAALEMLEEMLALDGKVTGVDISISKGTDRKTRKPNVVVMRTGQKDVCLSVTNEGDGYIARGMGSTGSEDTIPFLFYPSGLLKPKNAPQMEALEYLIREILK